MQCIKEIDFNSVASLFFNSEVVTMKVSAIFAAVVVTLVLPTTGLCIACAKAT